MIMKCASHFASYLIAALGLAGLAAEVIAQQPGKTRSATERKERPKRTLPDGRRVVGDELRVTLKEGVAREKSRDARGMPQPVNRHALRALHPQIAEIDARHTTARKWLNGEDIPRHLQKADGSVPRIARNFIVILRPGADIAAVREDLRVNPDVERVDFKGINELHATPNDPDYGKQWAPPLIGLQNAWDIPGRGRIRVAVVDTGAQMAHPELAARIVWDDGFADFDNGEAPGSGSSFDHGTHVAGIIGAIRDNSLGVAGYSHDIDLLIMNCATWDSDKGAWAISDADDAIAESVANGAHVINCSFAFDDGVETAVEDAFDASVLVVHAAGNNSNTIDGHWEAGSIALLTVTATMASGSPATDVFDNSYSNFGPGVDFAAPGTSILSTVPTTMAQSDCSGNPASLGLGCKQGTSMAAPQVSGAAAVVMSMNPTLIADESTRHLLIRMAEDKGSPGPDQQYGYGALRLRKSTLQACRDASTFVSSASTFPETGNYDRPWRTIPGALNNVPDGATLVLNGGVQDATVYRYAPVTITKPCTLSAIPDRPVIIGAP